MALDREYKQIAAESGAEGEGVSSEEVMSLKQRLFSVERSVESAVSKVEDVLSKLETNERAHTKRRDVLTRLLNPIIQVYFN